MKMKDQLEQLELNVRKLLFEMKELKDENRMLRERVRGLDEQLDRARESLADLENKNVNLQISKSFKGLDSKDAAGLKEKLDAFIHELDECINSLKE